MRDRETGQSRGFAFAEMETEEGAQGAIQKFNNVDFEGRQITVKEARPREDRPRSGGGGRGSFDRPSGGAPPYERRPPASAPQSRPVAREDSDFNPPSDDHGSVMPGPQEEPPRKPKRREHPKGGHQGAGVGADWDRPRRGRIKSDDPPPIKNRMRAWDLDDEGDEDLDDVDPWAGFDFLQEDEETDQE
jgi:RNA recognition motif-containing protein